jgi:TatD DNase family protein
MWMKFMLIDAHAHLDLVQYDEDRTETIARAQAEGVTKIINVGINSQSWQTSLSLAEKYPGIIYLSLGLHPNDVAHEPDPNAALANLRQIIQNNRDKVVAVGETGLDYYHADTPVEQQKQFFEAQIQLAKELNLPLVIHCRDAMPDIIGILQEKARNMPVMLHCFSGTPAEAQTCLELGETVYISIAGPVTFKNAHERHAVVKAVPLNRLLTETDCPFLTPVPYRGKRNEPARVKHVAEKIAELKNLTYEEVTSQISQNVLNLFKI